MDFQQPLQASFGDPIPQPPISANKTTGGVYLSIAFPFQKGVSSFPLPANDQDAIRASVIQILLTPKNTRIMRPAFGCDLHKHIFDINSASTNSSIESEVRSALGRWEPRVRVNSVEIDSDSVTEPGQLTITVTYTIILTKQTSTVVVGV